MRLALRHAVSVSTGLIVMMTVARAAATGHLLTFSLLPLYTTVIAMLIARRDAMRPVSSDRTKARKRGTIGAVSAHSIRLFIRNVDSCGGCRVRTDDFRRSLLETLTNAD
jgi:hypothetical protein